MKEHRFDMNCQACGNENSEDAQFCGICGASLTSGETSIGTELPMVRFGEAISRGFSNYFNFSGRATRAENWWFELFTVLVGIILTVADMMTGTYNMQASSGLLSGLFHLFVKCNLVICPEANLKQERGSYFITLSHGIKESFYFKGLSRLPLYT